MLPLLNMKLETIEVVEKNGYRNKRRYCIIGFCLDDNQYQKLNI